MNFKDERLSRRFKARETGSKPASYRCTPGGPPPGVRTPPSLTVGVCVTTVQMYAIQYMITHMMN